MSKRNKKQTVHHLVLQIEKQSNGKAMTPKEVKDWVTSIFEGCGYGTVTVSTPRFSNAEYEHNPYIAATSDMVDALTLMAQNASRLQEDKDRPKLRSVIALLTEIKIIGQRESKMLLKAIE